MTDKKILKIDLPYEDIELIIKLDRMKALFKEKTYTKTVIKIIKEFKIE